MGLFKKAYQELRDGVIEVEQYAQGKSQAGKFKALYTTKKGCIGQFILAIVGVVFVVTMMLVSAYTPNISLDTEINCVTRAVSLVSETASCGRNF